jgi:hypothetical protein
MESMRTPFLNARVNVVLFRHPWGQTPWTRVEDAAIAERCFKGGWESLMFVQLDKTSKLPEWLPPTHVRLVMAQYGFEQLIGAIKHQLHKQGGLIAPLDARGEAKRVRQEAKYLAKREAMMTSSEWIKSTLHPALRQTMNEIVRLAEEASAPDFKIIGVADDMTCVLRSGSVSMGMGWQQPIFGRVTGDDCYLRVGEFSGAMVLPKEGRIAFEKPRLLKEHKFGVDVSRDGNLVWVERGKKEHITASQLADPILRLFLNLV